VSFENFIQKSMKGLLGLGFKDFWAYYPTTLVCKTSQKTMNIKELLSRYTAGQRDFKNLNLIAANLRNMNLSGIDLSGANLTKANLTRTNLSYANLTDANLTGANLTETNLTRTNLRGVNLKDTNLCDAYQPEISLPDGVIG
jgi:hypothetical protein